MKIAFLGDIHGRIFHTLAVIATWEQQAKMRLDCVIQVGDFGAYPNPDENLRNDRFIKQDPTQLDFACLFTATDGVANRLTTMRRHLNKPVYFVRGNHEDFTWLDQLRTRTPTSVVPIDPFGLFTYVPDGTVLNVGGFPVAFLGGVETSDRAAPGAIDDAAYQELYALGPGSIHILVTHDAPYGISTNRSGLLQGSQRIVDLMAQTQPRYLIAGHYHHRNGPRQYGRTTYLGLNVLVHLDRDNDRQSVEAGSLAILDTETDQLDVVTDPWLAAIDRDFDFKRFVDQL